MSVCLPPVQQEVVDALGLYGDRIKTTVNADNVVVKTRNKEVVVPLRELNSLWLLHFLADFDDAVEKYAKAAMWSTLDIYK